MLSLKFRLGFPKAFTDLITRSAQVGQIGQSHTNPYLFRYTERRLVDEGIKPLSAIKDMIGSQTTKAMHVVARFAPTLRSPGIWTDGDSLTLIETCPKRGRDADIRDAKVCAEVAHKFECNRESLEGPTADSPELEGWIWAPWPNRCSSMEARETNQGVRKCGEKTTYPGYTNKNGQTVIRKTDTPGNDHSQVVYELDCGDCGERYGANGSDIWQRKCPKCGGGRPGLSYL